MADWTKFRKAMLDNATKVRTSGKDVERSLQIASGAVVLTMLSALPSTWVEPPAPLAQLRPIYTDVLIGAGGAFISALLATITRVVGFGTVENDEAIGTGELVFRLCWWATPIVLSLAFVLVAGMGLVNALGKVH